MKAVKIEQPGGLDHLRIVAVADPGPPGPGEIRVRIHASSLNFHDYAVVSGRMPTEDGRVPMAAVRDREIDRILGQRGGEPRDTRRLDLVLGGVKPHAASVLSRASTIAMRRPIQAITGTAIELPKALYRGPSGALSFPRQGMLV